MRRGGGGQDKCYLCHGVSLKRRAGVCVRARLCVLLRGCAFACVRKARGFFFFSGRGNGIKLGGRVTGKKNE